VLISHYLSTYRPAMFSLPADRPLTKTDLLMDDLLMERSGRLEMYYAPHNEYVNPSAKIIIIGITPGWTQMKTAYEEAIKALREGLDDEQVCKRAKEQAGFAGSMRDNLTRMLDALELPGHLGIPSSGSLFAVHRKLLHTTSLLRFPVFVNRSNYTGSQPDLSNSPFLKEAAALSVQEELRVLKRSLVIPLGRTVEHTLRLLEREGKLDGGRCLWGFPHPSGANGHRHKQFASELVRMKQTIQDYFTAGHGDR
jgi:hypothetical protein